LVPTPDADGYINDNKLGFYNHMNYRNSLHDSTSLKMLNGTKFEMKA